MPPATSLYIWKLISYNEKYKKTIGSNRPPLWGSPLQLLQRYTQLVFEG